MVLFIKGKAIVAEKFRGWLVERIRSSVGQLIKLGIIPEDTPVEKVVYASFFSRYSPTIMKFLMENDLIENISLLRCTLYNMLYRILNDYCKNIEKQQ